MSHLSTRFRSEIICLADKVFGAHDIGREAFSAFQWLHVPTSIQVKSKSIRASSAEERLLLHYCNQIMIVFHVMSAEQVATRVNTVNMTNILGLVKCFSFSSKILYREYALNMH